MGSWQQLYRQHIATLQARSQTLLAKEKLAALVIHSGELLTAFLDDKTYSFVVNPHFNAWLPVTQVANCWLWIDGVHKPKLYFYSPVDYWHNVTPLPQDFWTDEIELIPLSHQQDIDKLLPKQRQQVAYLGASQALAQQLGFTEINPVNVLNYLHYHRAYKTAYELACMRQAQKIAVKGHIAAKAAFQQGLSEYAINLAYLQATQQRDTQVPYSNIIALNQHAATLHYTELDLQAADSQHSFLIDAGASYHGYAADITRTYCGVDGPTEFADLITDLQQQQQALIASLQIGQHYQQYHQQMHLRLAELLLRHDLVHGLSSEAVVEQQISRAFLPHGLGHLLGLQVHDVAGFMQNEQGEQLAAPKSDPALRCTRQLAANMVFTIEPGLYFIDSILQTWQQHPLASHFNWRLIEQLKPCGGIRIEDNIVLHEDGIENMTRDLSLN